MSGQLDRLTLMATFARIADRGSISAAARDLGLSQASVSRQLKEIERRFGQQLVRRTTHSLSLTPAGRALLGEGRALVSAWEALEERHSADPVQVRGPLKVIGPIALGQTHLADLVTRFQQDHPDVSVTLQLTDEPVRLAEEGADCWVRIGPVPDETLVVVPTAGIERRVVAAPSLLSISDPAGPDDIARLPFLALAPYEGGDIPLHGPDGAVANIRPDVRMTSNNIVTIRRAVEAGLGAAILPVWFAADALADGRLKVVGRAWSAPTLSLSIAYLPAALQPRRLSAFVEAVRSGLADLPGLAPQS